MSGFVWCASGVKFELLILIYPFKKSGKIEELSFHCSMQPTIRKKSEKNLNLFFKLLKISIFWTPFAKCRFKSTPKIFPRLSILLQLLEKVKNDPSYYRCIDQLTGISKHYLRQNNIQLFNEVSIRAFIYFCFSYLFVQNRNRIWSSVFLILFFLATKDFDSMGIARITKCTGMCTGCFIPNVYLFTG